MADRFYEKCSLREMQIMCCAVYERERQGGEKEDRR